MLFPDHALPLDSMVKFSNICTGIYTLTGGLDEKVIDKAISSVPAWSLSTIKVQKELLFISKLW